MKKIFLIFISLIFTSVCAFAQPRAVGVRFGYGVSATYQHQLRDNTMITADVDLPGFVAIGATATHDWLNPFGTQIPWSTPKGEWNWFLGAGLSAGAIFYGNAAYAGVAGRAGLEYEFWFPLQLSAEWRPTFGPVFANGHVGFFGGGMYAGAIALTARYVF